MFFSTAVASLTFVALLLVLKTLLAAVSCPLSDIPGPWHTRFTNLALRLATLKGRRIFYVHSLHQRYGSIVRLSPTEIDVADLSVWNEIHRIGSRYVKSAWYESTHRGRNPGIFAMRDPKQHSQRRRLFARAFSYTNLFSQWEATIRQKAFIAVSQIEESGRMAKQHNTNRDRNGADVMRWWTLMATDIIAHLSFGESFHMLERGQQTPYIDAVQNALLGSVLRNEAPLLWHAFRWAPVAKLRAITQADRVVLEHGELAVQNMRKDGGGVQNLFGQMLATAEKDDGNITDDDIKNEAANLIVAGSDTTAVTLTYLIWAVLKQPILQKALESEVLGLSEDLRMDELVDQAPLLNSVIEETLRLYGAAPGALPRLVPSQGAQFNGYMIPGGVEVSTQAFTLHRDPDIWHDPMRFNGYRFLDRSTLTAAQKSAMHPFGAGSRVCIGMHLAWMELRIAAALFFRRCRGAELAPCMTDEMMEMDNRFLIAPKGHCCWIVLS